MREIVIFCRRKGPFSSYTLILKHILTNFTRIKAVGRVNLLYLWRIRSSIDTSSAQRIYQLLIMSILILRIAAIIFLDGHDLLH